MSTFYGKVEKMDQQKLIARRKTMKRVLVIALSSILLVGIVVAAVAGTQNSNKEKESNESAEHLSSSIKAVCNVTRYPDSCFTSLSPVARSGQPLDLFRLSMQVAKKAIQGASQHFASDPFWQSVESNNMMTIAAIKNCKTLLDLATDHIDGSLAASSDLSLIRYSHDDLKTWLSTAATCQETCLDGFEFETQKIQSRVTDLLRNSTELTSNSLAIVNFVSTISGSLNLGRKLLTTDDVPGWISAGARRLMASTNLTSIANITVSKDGTGQFKTISDALNSVPSKSNLTTIIYVKKGEYLEKVVVGPNTWNVVMMGDGSNKTIVSGSLNVVDGTPTFSSATFSVFGKGFMARDMGFYNTAGPSKQQAVALISTADMSVFYQCRFDAFQDTLYTHSNRQFYRKCDIIGTVDFIFGNAAVVFQTCNLLPRRPNPGQMNIITAQGKTDPNMNTGTSIQGCTIKSFNDLTGVKTYLGRPWKDFSTSIFMLSSLSNVIDPKGWLPWMGNTVPDTISYAEYLNTGVGAVTANRVSWKGLKLNLTSKAASAFTVKSFIQGDKWIRAGIAYEGGL